MKLWTFNATHVRPDDDYQKSVENKSLYKGVVSSILKKYKVDGFTIYEVDGYWEGVAEKSYKIEVATEYHASTMRLIASDLRAYYKQDAVMLTHPDNTVEFVEF